MDAAMVTAIAALSAAPLAALAAMYGTRGANRAAREGGAPWQRRCQNIRTNPGTLNAGPPARGTVT